MNLLDLLRKLGILRFGTEAAVYHSAQERPASFMMEGVYNEQKDLAGQEPSSRDLPRIKRV